MKMKFLLWILALLSISSGALGMERAVIEDRSKTPYTGAIVVEAGSNRVLFEESADSPVYPASTLKLMNLKIVLDRLRAGQLRLTDKVTISAAASKMGGSQVFLREGEVFTVEDLLYALMVQSANDAALALAEHVAGSKEGFVALMNAEAEKLGMKATRFHSVHGLPPAKGQEPDVTTARDFAKLCLALSQYPEVFTYTSIKQRNFRSEAKEPFGMQNHNKLLWNFDGCDGFKTGYFRLAGYSIAATATRNGRRVIAIVMGSRERRQRDAKAAELLNLGFSKLDSATVAALPETAPPASPTPTRPKEEKSPKVDFSKNPALP